MEIAIYGAQGIALGTYQAVHHLYPKRKIRCFLVSERGNNPLVLNGISVLELAFFSQMLSQEEKDDIEIFIATPENVMGEIEAMVRAVGFHYFVRLTSLRWAELMGYYYVCDKKYMPLSALPVGCRPSKIHMFMAKFYKDKPLTGKYSLPPWVVPIQVGASLCKERVADHLDCTGENNSDKNGNYSELTALYWIWKNCLMPEDGYEGGRHGRSGGNSVSEKQAFAVLEEYYGLSHYRRMLELSKDDELRLAGNQVDVVLPYPMPYEPDIEEHHKRYLADGDWRALLTALEELQPEYARVFPAILHQKYLYNYNIMLARKEVLNAYCSWLFPILERVEQLSEPKGWERKDRYIGYMGETLATLYFMVRGKSDKDKLNIVHTGCRFLT
ncbi:MAG: DUF4422 domain-containing protein [Lachnospiraceae bacterium]|nr:DUF4422 domain-containing protein [Lachnospiraceae bacterium]